MPPERDYRCKACGHEWSARSAYDSRRLCCPECGDPTDPKPSAPALSGSRNTEGKA